MLEREWRKVNPLTLLVGMKTDTDIMENIMEEPKKNKIELPYDPAIPFLGENHNSKRHMNPNIHRSTIYNS